MKKKFKSNPFSRGPKNLLFVVMFFIISIALLTKLADYTRQVKTMPFSTFLDKVEDDAVRSVHLAGAEVFGILKNGTRFESTLDTSFREKAINAMRDHSVEISVSQSSAQLSFWHLLFFCMFIMGITAVWYFFRQSRGGGGGGMVQAPQQPQPQQQL